MSSTTRNPRLAESKPQDEPESNPEGHSSRVERGLLRGAFFLRFLQPHVPETSTEEGRAAERHRRLALGAVSSGAARAVSIGTGLVLVPVLVHYLGTERYGLYATITAITALVGWADLGIGSGLVSELATAEGRANREEAARVVSTGFFALAALALALGAGFAAAYKFVPWSELFNVSGRGAGEAGAATAALVAGFLLALPLSVVHRTQLGLQENFVTSAWQAVGSVLAFVGIVVAVDAGASLPWIVLVFSAAPAVALAVNGADLFRRRHRRLAPSLRRVERQAAMRLLRIGALFFVLQVAGAVAYESDALVLTQVIGPSAVTTYSVTMRVFLIVPALASFVLTPLWPAYSEATSRGDVAWVERTLRRALRLALVCSVPAALAFLLAARPLISAWAGITPPFSLVAAEALWVVALVLSGVMATFLNGVRVIRIQIALAMGLMVTNLGVSIALAHTIGISGVVWGSVIVQTALLAVLWFIVLPRVLKRIRENRVFLLTP